tara:strand:+ start:225 stop:416 length:192 start_codon:yes stop_codon:yes gene_type:complete
MKLAEWLQKERRTQVWFAEQIGKHPNTIARYISGDRFPARKTMAKITEVTKGRVTHRDFLFFE